MKRCQSNRPASHIGRILMAAMLGCATLGCDTTSPDLITPRSLAPAAAPSASAPGNALAASPVKPSFVSELTPTTAPATQPADPAWPDIDRVMQRRGVPKDGVYVFTIPRDDLDVSIDGMGIPTAAGIESVFYFYRCPCGKMNATGQFVTTDYEANDVVDALRQDARFNVAAISPFLISEKPRLMLVRFQGEGDPAAMAKNLREALRWIGKERMAPLPADSGAAPVEKP